MKKSLILLVIIGLVLIVSSLYIGLFASVIGIALWILGLIYSEYGRRKQEKRDLTLLSGQEKIIRVQKETEEKVEEVKDIIVDEFTSRKILERIRRSLRGVLSTEELIAEFDTPLNALIIFKWGERHGRKLLRDRLSQLGFKDIGNGVKILPPSRMPDPPLKNRRDIRDWVEQNLLDALPKNHKYSIVFAQLIDLRKVYTTKYAPEEWADRFRGRTLFDTLSWEELFPIKFIRKALTERTHVSVEELIVEYFPFSFLVSRFLSDEDLERVLTQRDKIIQSLKEVFNLDSVTLINFADMNVNKLSQIVADLQIANPKQIAEDMIKEAKNWKIFLQNL